MEATHQAINNPSMNKMARSVTISSKTIWLSLVVSILLIGSFMGGIIYQKNTQPTFLNSSAKLNNLSRNTDKRKIKKKLVFTGQISSISANQITVTNQKSKKQKIYSLTPKSIVYQAKKKVSQASLAQNQNVKIFSSRGRKQIIQRIVIL
ncbi:MAG: hypothetical protein M1554_03570 [Patescibacteria group bacterium]|jgi:uncharacterized protein (UPF0333 family)|nr:hypothetical protein [Patescibacteria group bacterium]